ncbi:MAG: TIGR00266 family protein [Verrucomicrobiae bacterium]|nr:TIGR00266 family protein [Verrucomicrobiae bacterium]
MATWHYADANKQQFQIDESQLSSAVQQGVIAPNTPVWTSGMSNWAPAAQALSQLFPGGGAPNPNSGPPPIDGSGFVSTAGAMPIQSHVVDYEIFGDDMQIVEVELDPGETVIAEAGAMNYIEQDIVYEAKMGDGSQPNAGVMGTLLAVGKRALTGESIFMTHFTHRGGNGKRRVAFAAPYPGKIMAVNLKEIGGEITCQKDAFLCAALGTQVTIAFNKRLGAGFFGGEGFILQKLKGDGMAFMHAGGTVVERELKGETLRVDTGCLVAFSPGISYDIQRAGNLKSMFFGGEGLFLATLSGHGKVWLQSLPFSRMADRILAHAPSAGGKSTGEGSVLGGLGRLLDGD